MLQKRYKTTSCQLFPILKVLFKLLIKYAMIKGGSIDSISIDRKCALWHMHSNANLPLYIFNSIKRALMMRRPNSNVISYGTLICAIIYDQGVRGTILKKKLDGHERLPHKVTRKGFWDLLKFILLRHCSTVPHNWYGLTILQWLMLKNIYSLRSLL